VAFAAILASLFLVIPACLLTQGPLGEILFPLEASAEQPISLRRKYKVFSREIYPSINFDCYVQSRFGHFGAQAAKNYL
jgi:hypothetical protein